MIVYFHLHQSTLAKLRSSVLTHTHSLSLFITTYTSTSLLPPSTITTRTRSSMAKHPRPVSHTATPAVWRHIRQRGSLRTVWGFGPRSGFLEDSGEVQLVGGWVLWELCVRVAPCSLYGGFLFRDEKGWLSSSSTLAQHQSCPITQNNTHLGSADPIASRYIRLA